MICLFGERDKTQDKIWPKGTVELQQKALNIYEEAIIELYKRALTRCPWDGPPVPQSGDGRPLIHAILANIGTCKLNCSYFQEIKEKVGQVMKEESSSRPSQRPTKKEGDVDVKMEPKDSWPQTIPTSIQENPRIPAPMPQGSAQDASYPPSPPNEKTQPSAYPQAHISPSKSPLVTRRRRSNRTSCLPAQITLPTPNPSPDTEALTKISSSFGPLNYQNNTPQPPWPYGATAPSSNLSSYDSTPLLGGPAFCGDSPGDAQCYGWSSTGFQQSAEDQMLLSAMMDFPTSQNFCGFGDYPFDP